MHYNHFLNVQDEGLLSVLQQLLASLAVVVLGVSVATSLEVFQSIRKKSKMKMWMSNHKAETAVVSNNTNLAYTILPPRYDGGLHTAPVPQLVHFLSGVAHLTLPQDPSVELWLVGGKGGLLFATDTKGVGHITRYPSDQETVALTAPFADEKIPEHEVINEGPCWGNQTFS